MSIEIVVSSGKSGMWTVYRVYIAGFPFLSFSLISNIGTIHLLLLSFNFADSLKGEVHKLVSDVYPIRGPCLNKVN